MLSAALALSACGRKQDTISQVASIFATNSASKITAEQVRAVLDRDGKDGLVQLDKYCVLAGGNEKRLTIMHTSDKSVGIGVLIIEKDGYLVIGKAVEGAPAAQAGVREGDRIININGTQVVGMPMAEAQAIMAKNRQQLKLLIEHPDGQHTQRFEADLKPAAYQLPVASSAMLPGGTGYLRLMSLPEGISSTVKAEMDKLVAAGAHKVVIDLRYNNNGLLSEIPGLLKLFIGEGKTLFTAQSDKPGYNAIYKADAQAPFAAMQYAVIVNTQTVSGAEIMAASLHENTGAPVVGAKTPGQSGIQHMFTLADGRGLRLTVAFMLPPSGKQLEGQGVTPDAVVIGNEQQEAVIQREWFFSPGKVMPGDQYIAEALAVLARSK